MKKTWTTRILIALMTLAMVAGVVAIAPKAAQAAGNADFIIDRDSLQDGTKDQAYGPYAINVTGSATGGAVSVENSSLSGAGAAGLTTSTNGNSVTISGTPTTSGAVSLTIVYKNVQGSSYTHIINFSVIPAAAAPASVTAPALTDLQVGKSVNVSCVASGGYPTSYTYSATNLPAGLSISSDGKITGAPTTVNTATGTYRVMASNGNGYAQNDGSISAVAVAAAPTITLTGGNSVAQGESVTLTANGAPSGISGHYEWKKGTDVIAGATASTYTYTPASSESGTITFSSQWISENTNYASSVYSANKSVTIDNAKANAAIAVPANNASVSALTTIQLVGSSTTTGASGVWSQTGGAGTIASPNSMTGATYYVERADIGRTITFKLTVSATGFTQNEKTVTVRIYNNDIVTAPASNYTMSFNTATLYDVQTFSATTSYSGDVKISNSNPLIAEVTANGQTVPAGGISVPSGTQVSVKALAYGRTYIDVVPVSGSTTNGRRITVYVGSQTPTLEAQFWSSDGSSTMSKVQNWGTLKITVDNFNPQYPYVTVTRSNIRTYVQGGSYYSHPSTYTYTAALAQDLTDPLKATATLYVIPQYNGTTYYTASYTGATSKNCQTIYVTGYTTLPQTGPNYIWAYVLGGLCLATVATAVTLNVRKKKRESI